ncbi:MAG: transposase, partial [Puniceicoccales bacterium]|nr:transposase [Puniceicoccales bacterium]
MSQEDALIGLFIAVDDVCKKNDWDFSHDSGPACELHLSENSWKQVVNFAITKGSISDIPMARPLLQSLSDTGLGDRGYVSKDVRKALKNSGLNFIARARKNMKEKNTSEEIAHLSRRH